MVNKTYLETFAKHNLTFSQMISGSKSGYRTTFPDHLVIFNARIYISTYFEKNKLKAIRDFFAGQEEEIWYGDLDLNNHIAQLSKVAREIDQNIVVTTESGLPIVMIFGKIA